MRGLVLKNQNGYFSVLTEDGKIVLSRSRGRLKRASEIFVGDRVECELSPDGNLSIASVRERKSILKRPPVANVEQLVVTVAVRSPDVNLYTLDKMLLLAENAGISPLLCVNKSELAPGLSKKLAENYRAAGYPAVCVSAKTGEGLSALREALTGKIIAFSGPSGVGKSSLLNALLQNNVFETGAISNKTRRGKNTTRNAELIPFCDLRFLMDTPGFTELNLDAFSATGVASLLPDFAPFLGGCRFSDCRHLKEPDCAVLAAVEAGKISKERWNSYRLMLDEIAKNTDRY